MINEYIEVKEMTEDGLLGDIHIIPMFEGEKIHDGNRSCWCMPQLDIINMGQQNVWTHRRTH